MRAPLVLFLLAGPVLGADITGKPAFSDADTLKVAGVTIRLFGIDAPEIDQTCLRADGSEWACGQWAADEARRLFKRVRLTCAARELDRYGRTVATCSADGQDVGEMLVRKGIATAYRAYSGDYIAVEKEASLAGIGLWQGSFETPADYRAAKLDARAIANAETAPKGCTIKGNISSRGQIYHLPGQEGYDRTLINEAKGERWFCSEAEAMAAGWRKAGGG